jgi:hypothetical protein
MPHMVTSSSPILPAAQCRAAHIPQRSTESQQPSTTSFASSDALLAPSVMERAAQFAQPHMRRARGCGGPVSTMRAAGSSRPHALGELIACSNRGPWVVKAEIGRLVPVRCSAMASVTLEESHPLSNPPTSRGLSRSCPLAFLQPCCCPSR